MNCQNHPAAAAAGTCSGCAEAFCPNCLVNLRGTPYCGACKGMAVSAIPAPATTLCAEAKSAFNYSIAGIFLFGLILEPLAIAKALTARKKIAADPSLSGKGRADAALVVASLVFVIWAVGKLARARLH